MITLKKWDAERNGYRVVNSYPGDDWEHAKHVASATSGALRWVRTSPVLTPTREQAVVREGRLTDGSRSGFIIQWALD